MQLIARLLLVLFCGAVLAGAGAILFNRVALTAAPGLAKRLAVYLTTNVAATEADAALPELRPRFYGVAPERLFDAVHHASRCLGWEIEAFDAHARTLHAVVTTRLLRFKDDVKVRVDADRAQGGMLNVRSASRLGRGDFGANLRHVLDLQTAVDTWLDHGACR